MIETKKEYPEDILSIKKIVPALLGINLPNQQ